MTIFKTKILWIIILLISSLLGCIKANEDNIDKLKLQGQLIYSKNQNIVLFDLHNKIEQIIYSRQRTSEDILCIDVSPDNKTLILSLTDVIEGEKLALMEKKVGSPQTLIDYAHGEPYRGISWSPDGRKIAIVRGKGPDSPLFNLYVMSPQGKDIRIISDINPELGKPSWSLDSKRIIFAGNGSRVGETKEDEDISKKGTALNIGIFMVDIKTGVTNKIINSGFSPALSPDGQSIAYYEPDSYSKKAKLNLFNMENKKIITLLQTGWIGDQLAWSPDGKYILYPRVISPMGRQVLEVYSLEQKKSFQITETERIYDLVWK